MDFVLLSAAPSALVSDHACVSTFGAVRQVAIEDWSKLTSVRVWYENGPVELGVAGLDWPAAEEMTAVLEGGFCVLLEHGLMTGPLMEEGGGSSGSRTPLA